VVVPPMGSEQNYFKKPTFTPDPYIADQPSSSAHAPLPDYSYSAFVPEDSYTDDPSRAHIYDTDYYHSGLTTGAWLLNNGMEQLLYEGLPAEYLVEW